MQQTSLVEQAHQHLWNAGKVASGRSAQTLCGGSDHVLRQTVVALVAGQSMNEHANPGEATVYVLHGRVRLVAGGDACEGLPGDLLVVPDCRHALEALDDAVILLTVAKHDAR